MQAHGLENTFEIFVFGRCRLYYVHVPNGISLKETRLLFSVQSDYAFETTLIVRWSAEHRRLRYVQ